MKLGLALEGVGRDEECCRPKVGAGECDRIGCQDL
jgi:hypothetical protein